MKEEVKFTIVKDPLRLGFKIEIDINMDAFEFQNKYVSSEILFLRNLNTKFQQIIHEVENMMRREALKKYHEEKYYEHLPTLRLESEEERPKKTCKALVRLLGLPATRRDNNHKEKT